MKSIHEQYNDIIKKCKFISRPNEWFISGSEVKLDSDIFWTNCNKFNDGSALFYGLTNENYDGYDGELPREDGETCPLDEFYIYDEFGNEISELTLEEYKKLIRKLKLKQIND